MNKDNQLDIHITNAIVTNIEIDLGDEKPKYTISGKLLTKQGNVVSSFSFQSDPWREQDRIEVSLKSYLLSKELFMEFQPEILKKLGNVFAALPAPKEENVNF